MTPNRAVPVGGAPLEGVASGCPYCLAKQNPWPQPGTGLVFLRGSESGWRGTVVSDPWGTCPGDRFLVHMEYEKSSTVFRTVMPSHDLYVDATLYSVPMWMPPLSIEDNAVLHESLILSLPAVVFGAHKFTIAPDALWRVVATCWRLRLPLQRDDIWLMLEAHGVSRRQRKLLLDLFEFGIKVLTLTNGRPAIKRKRMQSMSQGRYLTEARRELNIKLFGRP